MDAPRNDRPARRPEPPDDRPEDVDDGLRAIQMQLAAIGAYLAHLTAATADGVRVRIRNLLIGFVAGVIGVAVLIAAVVSLSVYALRGAAGGLAAAFGREWLGELVTGIAGLGLIGAAVAVAGIRVQRALRARRVDKYEQRKRAQRESLGRDVDQAAKRAA